MALTSIASRARRRRLAPRSVMRTGVPDGRETSVTVRPEWGRPAGAALAGTAAVRAQMAARAASSIRRTVMDPRYIRWFRRSIAPEGRKGIEPRRAARGQDAGTHG